MAEIALELKVLVQKMAEIAFEIVANAKLFGFAKTGKTRNFGFIC